jgi:hypothetical protein
MQVFDSCHLKKFPLCGHCLMRPTYKVRSLNEISVLKNFNTTQNCEGTNRRLELVLVLGGMEDGAYPKHTTVPVCRNWIGV